MIKATIKTASVERMMRTATKQVRFAAAQALTEAARDYERVATVLMRQSLDRPTPFSQRAIRSRGATASKLQAKVFVMPIQAAYLAPHVDGGTVSARKPSPTPIAENQYGNLPKGATKRAKVFSVRPRRTGKLLTYQRMGGKWSKRLRLLAVESKVRHYSKRWPFYERAATRVPVIVRRVFARHLASALGSARW
jgi:hypothetical protein